nr:MULTISPECIES: hypothetical protein [unclassified Ochrobactrum]
MASAKTLVSKFEQGERRLDIAEFIVVSREIGMDLNHFIQIVEEEGGI